MFSCGLKNPVSSICLVSFADVHRTRGTGHTQVSPLYVVEANASAESQMCFFSIAHKRLLLPVASVVYQLNT